MLQILGSKSMTDSGTVEVLSWKDSDSPVPSFLCEGKLFLTVLWYVYGEESISKIHNIICP